MDIVIHAFKNMHLFHVFLFHGGLVLICVCVRVTKFSFFLLRHLLLQINALCAYECVRFWPSFLTSDKYGYYFK